MVVGRFPARKVTKEPNSSGVGFAPVNIFLQKPPKNKFQMLLSDPRWNQPRRAPSAIFFSPRKRRPCTSSIARSLSFSSASGYIKLSAVSLAVSISRQQTGAAIRYAVIKMQPSPDTRRRARVSASSYKGRRYSVESDIAGTWARGHAGEHLRRLISVATPTRARIAALAGASGWEKVTRASTFAFLGRPNICAGRLWVP